MFFGGLFFEHIFLGVYFCKRVAVLFLAHFHPCSGMVRAVWVQTAWVSSVLGWFLWGHRARGEPLEERGVRCAVSALLAGARRCGVLPIHGPFGGLGCVVRSGFGRG